MFNQERLAVIVSAALIPGVVFDSFKFGGLLVFVLVLALAPEL